jgi:hypothetical protein
LEARIGLFLENVKKTEILPKPLRSRLEPGFEGQNYNFARQFPTAQIRFPIAQASQEAQAKCSTNLFTLFDFGLSMLGQ